MNTFTRLALAFFATTGFALATASVHAAPAPTKAATIQLATFAGGCFWCMQPPFDHLKSKGVIETVVGYTGGHKDNPPYEEVSSGSTGHFEGIQIKFDSSKISYSELLHTFWTNIDPFDPKGEFCDKGQQYTSAIFYENEDQRKSAEKSLTDQFVTLKNHPLITTKIIAASKFYPAEEYHQAYYSKNPIRYRFYRNGCGRDKRLKEVWGDLSGGH